MVPPGWPKDLPPAGTAEFEARVVSWLLDRGPAELRTSSLRNSPLALAFVVSYVLAGSCEGARDAYRTARNDLAGLIDQPEFVVVQSGLEALGAQLAASRREVDLVSNALLRASEGGVVDRHLDSTAR